MHYVPDKKLRFSYISGFEPDRLAWIVVNHALNLTNKFVSFFLIRTDIISQFKHIWHDV